MRRTRLLPGLALYLGLFASCLADSGAVTGLAATVLPVDTKHDAVGISLVQVRAAPILALEENRARLAPAVAANANTQPSMELGVTVVEATDGARVATLQAEAAKKNAELGLAFGNCVVLATKSWQQSPTCPLVGANSKDEMCSWWLEENCIVDPVSNCESVDTMCSLELRSFAVTGNLPWLSKSLMFMHIPKNGGTSIEEAAFDSGIMWGRHFMGGLVTMPGNKPCIKYHVPPTYLPDPGAYLNSEVFCVTRHPYERVVSEYIYLLRMSWGSHFSPTLYEKPACSAEGLNHFVTTELQKMQGGGHFGLDCHMVPQSDYLFGSGGQKWCQHPLRFDQLPHAFNDLMKTMQYPVTLGDTAFENTRGSQCPGLSVEDLSQESKSLLNEIYSRDFSGLGYEKG